MPQNFIEADREQAFLLPPSLRDWLAEDHLAWFVIAAVDEMDLAAFYGAYRADGHGRAAYDPAVMVALVLYSFATDERSARGIERHCRQDVAYRVICGNRVPDHATIARFLVRHESALADLFSSVLRLCDRAGLVASGIVAIDGTKFHANASRDANVDYDQIAREVIADAIATDEAEDEIHGDARGDELPEELQSEAGRRAWLARELGRDRADQDENTEPAAEHEFDQARIVARVQGRHGWLLEAKRQLDQDRWRAASKVARSRSSRLREAGRRLENELDAERRGNEAYEEYRAHGRMKNGRRLGHPPKPYMPPDSPPGEVNMTDPDSRVMKAFRGWVQGYNVQTAVNEHQIALAGEITVETIDFGQLSPMTDATVRELEAAGISDRPSVILADAGYWNEQHMDDVTAEHGLNVLIPPDSSRRKGPRPGWTGGRPRFMRQILDNPAGSHLYRQRKQTVEPVFAHTKHNRHINRFHRRGRTAVRTEWRLILMTHNLTKLHRYNLATATG
jgi:transposase